MPFITLEERISIYYEELGKGDRYVICSQVSHGKYSLERELAKRGFHVYLLTNRGFGRSTHIKKIMATIGTMCLQRTLSPLQTGWKSKNLPIPAPPTAQGPAGT